MHEMADKALALLGETEWHWDSGDPEEIFRLEGTRQPPFCSSFRGNS